MENTPIQKRIIKAFEELTETRVVYPSYQKVADKARVSKKYAFNVIREWQRQSKAFGLK